MRLLAICAARRIDDWEPVETPGRYRVSFDLVVEPADE